MERTKAVLLIFLHYHPPDLEEIRLLLYQRECHNSREKSSARGEKALHNGRPGVQCGSCERWACPTLPQQSLTQILILQALITRILLPPVTFCYALSLRCAKYGMPSTTSRVGIRDKSSGKDSRLKADGKVIESGSLKPRTDKS